MEREKCSIKKKREDEFESRSKNAVKVCFMSRENAFRFVWLTNQSLLKCRMTNGQMKCVDFCCSVLDCECPSLSYLCHVILVSLVDIRCNPSVTWDNIF